MLVILLGLKPTFNQFSKINWASFPPGEAETLPASPFNRKQKIPPIGKIRVTAQGAVTWPVTSSSPLTGEHVESSDNERAFSDCL